MWLVHNPKQLSWLRSRQYKNDKRRQLRLKKSIEKIKWKYGYNDGNDELNETND